MALEQFGVGLHQARWLIDAGVVDQAVQAAECLGRTDRGLPVLFLRHVLAHEARGAAEFGGKLAAFRFQHVADDDARAFRDAQTRLGGALPARAAADQDDFVLETIHSFLPGSRGV